MQQQIIIIGLGQFGMSLARNLSERGVEILAVDMDQEKVDAIAPFVANAVAIDATDEMSLAQLRPASRNSVICAMGHSSKEAAVICTALLRQMGCQHIVARATSKTYHRILQLVGAHEVINPELDFGKRFATHLIYRGLVVDSVPEYDLELTEIRLPESMIGKSLAQLALPKRYEINVVAIKRNGERLRVNPSEPLAAGDILLIVADERAIAKLAKEA